MFPSLPLCQCNNVVKQLNRLQRDHGHWSTQSEEAQVNEAYRIVSGESNQSAHMELTLKPVKPLIKYDFIILAGTGPSLLDHKDVDLTKYGFVVGVNTYWQYGKSDVCVVFDRVFDYHLPIFACKEAFRKASRNGVFFYNRESQKYGNVFDFVRQDYPVDGGDKLLAFGGSGATPALNLAINMCKDGGTIGLIGIDYIYKHDTRKQKKQFDVFARNCLSLCKKRGIRIFNYSTCSKVKSIPFATAPWSTKTNPRTSKMHKVKMAALFTVGLIGSVVTFPLFCVLSKLIGRNHKDGVK